MSIFSKKESLDLPIPPGVPLQVSGRMSAKEIRRLSPKSISAMDETKAIAVEALEVLGYNGLTRHIMTPLGDVLRSLEIDILDDTDVAGYMKSITGERKWGWIPLNEESRKIWNYQREIYSAPIPQFVLRKAIQIKKALPEVGFFVRTADGDPDPFLWVGLRNFDSYYIEVWDEPKFEKL